MLNIFKEELKELFHIYMCTPLHSGKYELQNCWNILHVNNETCWLVCSTLTCSLGDNTQHQVKRWPKATEAWELLEEPNINHSCAQIEENCLDSNVPLFKRGAVFQVFPPLPVSHRAPQRSTNQTHAQATTNDKRQRERERKRGVYAVQNEIKARCLHCFSTPTPLSADWGYCGKGWIFSLCLYTWLRQSGTMHALTATTDEPTFCLLDFFLYTQQMQSQ